jgi:hypothetical protein
LGSVITTFFHLSIADSDFRRSRWLYDRVESWLDGEALRPAIHIASAFAAQTNPMVMSEIAKLIELLLPTVMPLANLPQHVVLELAEIVQFVFDKLLSQNPTI